MVILKRGWGPGRNTRIQLFRMNTWWKITWSISYLNHTTDKNVKASQYVIICKLCTPSPFFFVISLLPQQESNRLSIWRKKCLTCITPVAIAAIYNLPTGFITLVFGYTSLVISRLYSSFFCRRFTLHFCAVVHWYGAINLIILAIFKSCFVWTLIARDCWQGERHIKNIFELRNFALKPPKFRGTQWLFAVK